jgi:hypothetical protein
MLASLKVSIECESHNLFGDIHAIPDRRDHHGCRVSANSGSAAAGLRLRALRPRPLFFGSLVLARHAAADGDYDLFALRVRRMSFRGFHR